MFGQKMNQTMMRLVQFCRICFTTLWKDVQNGETIVNLRKKNTS